MFADAPDFDAWFPEPDGFPRPDWKAIRQYIRSHSTEERWSAAWEEIARTWLERTCRTLGGAYTLCESANFHVVSELDERGRKQLLAFLEQARTRVIHALADIHLPKRYGKHAVLRFTERDDYYRYIAYSDPEGDWVGSSGKFIRVGGYMHIVYPHEDHQGADRQALARQNLTTRRQTTEKWEGMRSRH